MPILTRLIDLYRSRGFVISTGLNPRHFDGLELAPFTWLLKDGKSVTNGLGIAMQEIYFLECLLAELAPRHTFVIGNSFGWSTLALGLLAPQGGRVVAIDSGFDPHSLEGIALTNRIAAEEGLPVTVVEGASPEAVAPTVAEHLSGKIDLALIDGLHTDAQIVIDFEAVRPHLAPGAVVLFHDIQEFKMHAGWAEIAGRWDGPVRLLLGTPSGMAILYPADAAPGVVRVVEAFSAHADAVKAIEAENWRRRHRHRLRIARSIDKRLRKWGLRR